MRYFNNSTKDLFKLLLVGSFIVTPSHLSIAQPEIYWGKSSEQDKGLYFDVEDEPVFTYGNSCEYLVELSAKEIKSLLHVSNKEHFKYFCLKEFHYDCKDYEPLLLGLGKLQPSPYEGVCQVIINSSQEKD